MKMNKTKIIVPALALAMGAALAGSISGTVAWFQYSTRAQAAYIGTTAHCSENLQIKVGSGEWKTDLKSSDIIGALAEGVGTKIQPISSQAMTATSALPENFVSNPIYQFTDPATWNNASIANYVQFDLSLRVLDVDGTGSAFLEKDLYLTDLTITANNPGETNPAANLYKAIRVHFSSGTGENVKNALYARDDDSTATTITTNTYGKLDLNDNGEPDKAPGYEWDNRGDALVYGSTTAVAEPKQVANNVAATNVLASDANPSAITPNQGLIGKIPANANGLTLKVTIWLEGWQKLSDDVEAVAGVDANVDGDYEDEGDTAPVEGNIGAMWDPEIYLSKKFQVGMRFAVNAHKDSVDHAG